MHLGTFGFVCRCSGWEYFTMFHLPLYRLTAEISDGYNRLQPKINNRFLRKLIELIRKINVDKEQDYTVTAYDSPLDSTWSVFMSILRFNATVPWNGQSIALSVTHGCVHDSRPYLFTIAVFHGFFLLRFIILVIFIKIFVLIFFCRFLWQRQEDRNTSNLTCSLPSTWRISPSESCLARVTRLARNCRKQKGTRLWMSDFYSPPCGLRIQPTLISQCRSKRHFRKCPSCQRTRGRCACGLLSVGVLPTTQKH